MTFIDCEEVAFTPGVAGKFNGHVEEAPARPPGITACELQRKQFEPIRWVVPEIIVEGLTLLAGKPKRGKSWLALNCALAVASGGKALGNIACEQGDVLALMLEDNQRRLQDRMRKLEPSAAWPERLMLYTAWPRLDAGGLAEMEAWLQAAERPRLIVVDILASVRGSADGRKSMYADDYGALAGLQQLSSKHRIAIVAVHHCRKAASDNDVFDEISCTTGLTGAADSALVLKRGEGRVDYLHGRGRDLPEFEKAVSFDQTFGLWTLLGEADQFRGADAEQKIIGALSAGGQAMSVRQIAEAVEAEYQATKQRLYRMASGGRIRKTERGKFSSV
jgi:AAA domain